MEGVGEKPAAGVIPEKTTLEAYAAEENG